jgi:glutathione S-transferase
VLLEYLEDAYPNTNSLLPEDPIDRARARIWIDHISKKILPTFFGLLQAQDLEKQEEAKGKLFEGLQKFTKELAPSSSGPYFFGDRFTIVDVALAPWALRVPPALKTFKNIEIPTSGGEGDVWNRFKEWTDAVVTRESVQRTTSDADRYLELYSKYANNTAQSEVAKATREGKPLP